MSFFDVLVGQVAEAGRRVSAGAGEWAAWAAECEETLRLGPGAARESTVADAGEEYVGIWAPRLFAVALDVDGLGADTTSGAGAVGNADIESNGHLLGLGAREDAGRQDLDGPL
jgi:hypothetical protein